MPRSQEPLLRRPSTEQQDRDIEEEDALLTGSHQATKGTTTSWADYGISIWAALATAAVIILAILLHQSQTSNSTSDPSTPTGKRNLVMTISDGMGPTSLALTRSYRQAAEGLPFDSTLHLDDYEIGKSRTRSSSSLITDSAAGATAFSCGKKSYNGAISVLPDHTPCGTVLEAAKKAGYMTGLVVTTRITDATPACFAAHVNKREEEDAIAAQLLGDHPLGRQVDVMLGAGRGHFLPNTTKGSSRKDDRDLIQEAKIRGFQYLSNREEFDHLDTTTLPILGLFANEDIPYEMDRQYQEDTYPSLQEMAATALETLSAATKDKENGFFLMIEGSRIDHAGHANDPAAQVHEVLAYDETFKQVVDFLDQDATPGLLIGTSDHETGGLSTASQNDPFMYPEYRWFPEVLMNATHSHHYVASAYAKYLHARSSDLSSSSSSSSDASNGDLNPRSPLSSSPPSEIDTTAATKFLHNAIRQHLGIHDATPDEISLIIEKPLIYTGWLLSAMISRRAQTGWSTHGHSGADVNIYASDPSAARALQGNHENTEIGNFMARYLGVDLEGVTGELVGKGRMWDQEHEDGGVGWMGRRPEEGEDMDGGSHLVRYRGEFAREKRECAH